MDNRDEALISQLVETDGDLRRCWSEHVEFERLLEDLNRRIYLTPAEELERKRLQKLKLAGRDEMERILAKYRTGQS
jgi:uncharacterized protein YdcH (DUF465 family)